MSALAARLRAALRSSSGGRHDGVELDEEEDMEGREKAELLPMSSELHPHTHENMATASVESPRTATSVQKMPWGQLLIGYFVVMSDSIALNVVTPFVADLCRVRWGISEEYVGIASGFILGAFPFATFLSSFLIGHLSDRYGRRPLLLMGTLSGTICTFLFAVSPYFWMGLSMRLLGGTTNANAAVTKAVLADLTRGETRALAFAYLGAAFSLARAITSGVSGLTTGITWDVPLFRDPFMLPCTLAAGANLLAFVCVVLFVPETLKPAPAESTAADVGGKPSLWHGLKAIHSDRLLRKLIGIYCLNTFLNGGLILLIILIMALPTADRGLGLSPNNIGVLFTLFGGLAFLYQILVFKRVLKWLNIIRTYYLGTVTIAFASLLVPLPSLVSGFASDAADPYVVWPLCVLIFIFAAPGFMMCLPLLSTMQSNASDQSRQGLVLGTANSMGNLFRSVGPIVGGVFFSGCVAIGMPTLIFLFQAGGYLICLYLMWSCSDSEKLLCSVPADDEGQPVLRRVLHSQPAAAVPDLAARKPDGIEGVGEEEEIENADFAARRAQLAQLGLSAFSLGQAVEGDLGGMSRLPEKSPVKDFGVV